MKLIKSLVALAAFAAASAVFASEFWEAIPTDGSTVDGNLRNDKASGGGGFASVRVSGYNGVGGQFDGYFWTGATSPVPPDSFFRFFCIQLAEHAAAGPITYTASILHDDDLRKLFDIAYPNDTKADFWNGGKTDFGEFSSATMAAAFQVAVWNIVFDNDLELLSGSFQWTGAPSAVSVAAQNLLYGVESYSDDSDSYTHWTLFQFINRGKQDYVAATYRVPEPGTLGMLGAGLLAFAIAGRRRRH